MKKEARRLVVLILVTIFLLPIFGGCTAMQKAGAGAGFGSLIGAGIGSAIGGSKGALLGAGIGAITGGLGGAAMGDDQTSPQSTQQPTVGGLTQQGPPPMPIYIPYGYTLDTGGVGAGKTGKWVLEETSPGSYQWIWVRTN